MIWLHKRRYFGILNILWTLIKGHTSFITSLASEVVSPPAFRAYPEKAGMEIMLRANGRNIVGCYILRPFAHPVTCCWELSRKRFESGQTLSCVQTDATISNNVASVCSPCCMLLGVVAQTVWNRSNLICVQTDATIPTMLASCWPTILRPFAHSVACCCIVWSYCAKFETDQTLSYAQTDANIPNNVASVCSPCCTLLCCCAKFETGQALSYVQTDATIPNNVGELLANDVASVCT